MVINFQNTFDEYVEASETLTLWVGKRKKPTALRWIFLASLALYVFVGAIAVHGRTLTFHFWFPFWFGGFWVIVLAIIKAFSTPKILAKLLISFASLAIGLGLLIHLEHAISPTAEEQLHWSVLLPHLTWMFMALWFLVLAIFEVKRRRHTWWRGQPHVHRPKTADISAHGIVISDGLTRHEYAWIALLGWRESRRLFVLFISEMQFIFIPKKAFPSDEELSAMRALAELIPKPDPAGFQVVPSTAVPPPLPQMANTSNAENILH